MPVWLTGTGFLAAADLVLASSTTLSGYTELSCSHDADGKRLVIHRLRKELATVPVHPDLITSDGATRYAIDESFYELPVPSFVSREVMAAFEALRKQKRHCVVTLSEYNPEM
jgi:hypothetical protein